MSSYPPRIKIEKTLKSKLVNVKAREALTSRCAYNFYMHVYIHTHTCIGYIYVTGFGKTCIVHTSDFAHSKVHKT